MPNMGMINDNSPLTYLFSKNRLGLLELFYRYPHKSYYVNELVRQVASGSGAVQRELAAMTAAKIITRERKGNLVFYQANPDSPIFNELKSIITKT